MSSKSLKSLSKTRWSCRAEATEAFVNNYDGVYNTLDMISKDHGNFVE